eukprot:11159161-Lingulodinium_polyedra.AAC.1
MALRPGTLVLISRGDEWDEVWLAAQCNVPVVPERTVWVCSTTSADGAQRVRVAIRLAMGHFRAAVQREGARRAPPG